MSSAFSAIDTPSIPLNNFIRAWPTDSPSKPLNLVTLTSIQTETVYPTWVYTISGSGPDSSTTTTALDSSTLNPTTVAVALTTTELSTTKQNTIISTVSSTATIITESSTSTLIPTTSVLSSSMGGFPISATSESSDYPSSMWIPPVPLTSSSISLSSSLPVLPGTATSSVSSMSSFSTSASSSTTPSNKPSISPSIGTSTSASSSETARAENSTPSKVGTIVGSIIGGSAITIFALLACALYMRRRRRKTATERLGIRQELLRGDSTSSSISHHHRYHSYPSIPANIGPRPPILPFIPLQQQQPSNPDLSLDSMYLRGETAQDPFADPPSAVIEISAPSRSVSIYSTSSRDTRLGRQGYSDCEREGSDYLAVPHGYLDTPVMRDSMRSDPFDLDLEPPPNAHHRSSIPPIPSTWGVKF
ncbi:hypothetical protein N7536_006707 [Penicillium majusculum]|uniref:Uncharacterized protein n=1 Tax=Penicillium solitum TaxID=60172 RepID=A0A1V6QJD6_9EURO|nr:uncharacterized protein PENSOL_c064G01896 [Penicillium solitum]KAJ5696295.1 hypothetical protein N7536_006707 [Penicillium majusculum]OQD89321.1 hypothetical protein PENSOL_c064G01896 [Penicillium solitum]